MALMNFLGPETMEILKFFKYDILRVSSIQILTKKGSNFRLVKQISP
jgi:hypothetical protein